MQPNEYQRLAMRTDCYTDTRDAALGMASEAGEVAGKISKVYRDKGGVFSPDDIKAILLECGDVLWGIAKLTTDFGGCLDDVMGDNIAKLADRKKRGVIGGSGDYR
jgi:NTP pyrophosphatase (non-canonical NTP hydrolase)